MIVYNLYHYWRKLFGFIINSKSSNTLLQHKSTYSLLHRDAICELNCSYWTVCSITLKQHTDLLSVHRSQGSSYQGLTEVHTFGSHLGAERTHLCIVDVCVELGIWRHFSRQSKVHCLLHMSTDHFLDCLNLLLCGNAVAARKPSE